MSYNIHLMFLQCSSGTLRNLCDSGRGPVWHLAVA
jgi:hypothetical protein